MPSHLDLAMMSKQIYFENGGFLSGWTSQAFYKDEDGLAVGVYVNDKNEMVIAFRGTDTGDITAFLKNLMTNYNIALGKEPNTFKNASQFVEQIRGSRTTFVKLWDLLTTRSENQLYLTGHSLGGMLAALVGYRMLKEKNKQYRVVTFESPGIGHYISPEDKRLYAHSFSQFYINYLADPNIINTLHPIVGKIRHVPIKPYSSTFIAKGQFYGTHAVDSLINDAFRLILLLLILNLIFVTVMGKNAFTAAVSFTADQLSGQLQNHGYLAPIDTADPLDTLLFFLKSLTTFISCKIVTKAYNATSRQHQLDNLIAQFTKGQGEPALYSEMAQWPDPKKYVTSHFNEFCRWFNPAKSPSLLTLKKANELHEEMIKSIPGYEVQAVVKRC